MKCKFIIEVKSAIYIIYCVALAHAYFTSTIIIIIYWGIKIIQYKNYTQLVDAKAIEASALGTLLYFIYYFFVM